MKIGNYTKTTHITKVIKQLNVNHEQSLQKTVTQPQSSIQIFESLQTKTTNTPQNLTTNPSYLDKQAALHTDKLPGLSIVK